MITFGTTRTNSAATIVDATGRLDMLAAPQLKALIQTAVTNGEIPVVIDLSGITFMDSTGLAALISGLRITRQAGSDLRIAGATSQVLSVLQMTGIDRILQPYANTDEALHAA